MLAAPATAPRPALRPHQPVTVTAVFTAIGWSGPTYRSIGEVWVDGH